MSHAALAAALLCGGCATQPVPGDPTGVAPGVHQTEPLIIVLHDDAESLREATPAGHWYSGMKGYSRGQAVHVIAPSSWSDADALCMLGHEILHVLGAWHEGRQGC